MHFCWGLFLLLITELLACNYLGIRYGQGSHIDVLYAMRFGIAYLQCYVVIRASYIYNTVHSGNLSCISGKARRMRRYKLYIMSAAISLLGLPRERYENC